MGGRFLRETLLPADSLCRRRLSGKRSLFAPESKYILSIATES